MKNWKYIAMGVGALFTGKVLLSLRHASTKVITTVTGKKDQITAQGISLLISYNIKNPTKVVMKMTAPLIKLSIEGKVLASSTMQEVEIPQVAKDESGRIVIGAFRETGAITTRILIPWLSVLNISPQIMDRLQTSDPNQKVKLTVTSIAQLYTSVGNFPYEEQTIIHL